MYTSQFNEKNRQNLEGEINISDLEEWYTPRLKSLLAFPDSDHAQMISEIEMGMVDLQIKTITQDHLKKRVREKLSPTI